ncbi:hypothetical protein EJ02DRAFT_458437 [Clathrospora elynae]|uniref:RanBP2-type domain-containing protein n=1 Tax=Clathrospora elynae TaxID=706981 RepID=A0A6A5SDJ7_9PLEO|nr:hypothetical protein EJ02DRAFT_458437 [Clathrospora elynae]
MPDWKCKSCRWPNDENAECCTRCEKSTLYVDPDMTEGSSSEEEDEYDPATPEEDEVPQHYGLPFDEKN